MRPLLLALGLLGLAVAPAPETAAQPKPARLVLVVHAENKVDHLQRSTLRNI